MSKEILCLGEAHGDGWSLYNGDCVDLARQWPSESVDFGLHSPPFSSLYTYSDSERDMGNAVDDAQFFEHYRYLIREHYRILRPGRLVAVHCKQLVDYAGSDGRAGLRDFRGEIIRAYEAEGFKYHSEVTIWKCPVTEMQRTKAHGLLYKTLRTDASFTRQGMAEYLVIFRKWPTSEAETAWTKDHKILHNPDEFPLSQWQEWASPVWTTIDQTDVLNVTQARDDRDEKHICPLQLQVIDRAVVLWSNPGDVVFSPFAGIGSEGVGALKRRRKFVGFELKPSYFGTGTGNLRAAEPMAPGTQLSLM